MSHKENNQEKFIKDTFNKLHTNITQFLLDTNYSNAPSIKLRNEIEEFKSKIQYQEKLREIENSNYELYRNSNIIHKYFPSLIKQTKDPKLLFPNSLLFTSKNNPKNIFRSFHDINYKEKKENAQSHKNKNKKKNLNIKINMNNQYNDKYYKYNNDEKNKKFFHKKIQDIYNNTLINNAAITRGIYDMTVKKLIPRGADVSPTMNLWGSPFKIIGNEVFDVYKKSTSKDDVGICETNRLIPNKYNINEFYRTQPLINQKKYFSQNKMNDKVDYNYNYKKNNIFITTNDDNIFNRNENIINNKNRTMYNYLTDLNLRTKNDIKAKTFYDVLSQKNDFFK